MKARLLFCKIIPFFLSPLLHLSFLPIHLRLAGLIASTFFDPPHDGLIDRMFADICQEELDFMVDFGLIDTDGQVSLTLFVVLISIIDCIYYYVLLALNVIPLDYICFQC